MTHWKILEQGHSECFEGLPKTNTSLLRHAAQTAHFQFLMRSQLLNQSREAESMNLQISSSARLSTAFPTKIWGFHVCGVPPPPPQVAHPLVSPLAASKEAPLTASKAEPEPGIRRSRWFGVKTNTWTFLGRMKLVGGQVKVKQHVK